MDEPDRNRRFREDFEALAQRYGLQSDEVASFCMGVVLTLCAKVGEDPIEFARWALREQVSIDNAQPNVVIFGHEYK